VSGRRPRQQKTALAYRVRDDALAREPRGLHRSSFKGRASSAVGLSGFLYQLAITPAMSWYIFVPLVVVLASATAILIAVWLEHRNPPLDARKAHWREQGE
jgi:predicted outer membrane lipoprotein